MIPTSGSESSCVAAAVMPPLPVTVDTQGRLRISKEQRRILLAELERSGASAAQFARRTGLKYSTLAGWLQRHRRAKRRSRAQPVRLLEAVVASSTSAAALTLWWPGGARLEITEAGQIPLAAALVQALEKPC